ncbi:MAG: Gfo/Idh/MocA family oxidoreductase [Sediminibacterium sp.]
MKDLFNRRSFLKNTATTATGMALLSSLPKKSIAGFSAEPKIRFSVIGINHGHISGMVNAVTRGGGELVAVYAKEPDLLANFTRQFPKAKVAASEKEILEDNSIQLIMSSGIPDERGPLGVRVMKHGKDYLVDKPGLITLEHLAEARKVQKETKRIYSIMFSERFENKATVKAGEIAKSGAIGTVVQTVIMAPHRMSIKTRPEWFFDKKRYGGIITDIGSHQFDQFLYFTGSTKADIIASQVGNLHYPQYPKFEDFGDIMLRGNNGSGYIRVDWFTPDGLNTWGDGRLTILGTDGYIEVRKNTDIASDHKGGNHLYLVTQKETKYIDCNQEPLPFGETFVNDIVNRTENAMTQEHCFLATELALKAQKNAQWITNIPK